MEKAKVDFTKKIEPQSLIDIYKIGYNITW